MTAPNPTTFALDQAVISTGLALIRAELADERDEAKIAELHEAYDQALKARWPNA